MSFTRREAGGVSFLAVEKWWREGLAHGFTGSDLDFPGRGRLGGTGLAAALGASAIYVPAQVHGREVLDLRNCRSEQDLPSASEADALLARPQSAGIVFGIRTADCVPVIVRVGDELALIHAGWRGVAARIVEAAIEKLGEGSRRIEAAIGPCISQASYEVGEEVLDAIGSDAVSVPGAPGKAMLSLSSTIAKRLGPDVEVFDCTICTFIDRGFHSYRRDRERAGRNLCFALC